MALVKSRTLSSFNPHIINKFAMNDIEFFNEFFPSPFFSSSFFLLFSLFLNPQADNIPRGVEFNLVPLAFVRRHFLLV